MKDGGWRVEGGGGLTGGPTHSVQTHTLGDVLGESKVGEFDVLVISFAREKQILRLQITVHDAVRMKKV